MSSAGVLYVSLNEHRSFERSSSQLHSSLHILGRDILAIGADTYRSYVLDDTVKGGYTAVALILMNFIGFAFYSMTFKYWFSGSKDSDTQMKSSRCQVIFGFTPVPFIPLFLVLFAYMIITN